VGDDYSRSLPDNSRIHFLSALTFFAVGIGRLRGLPLPPTPNLSRAAREIMPAEVLFALVTALRTGKLDSYFLEHAEPASTRY
jgi:hypothetical protein